MSADSYLAEMEEMQTLVAESLYEDEVAILDALAPDGVPFGMRDNILDNNGKIAQYLTQFKGNTQAQQEWIAERVQQSINLLEAAGIPLDAAAENDARVWEIAMNAALYYSSHMEGLVRAQERRAS